ncbi:unnamed protein product [Amoebophrya sp. A25]|nr:unnamed protein product [Amoebophrya sp. A25]|eukprot:GSA25T00007660001.1
MPSINTMVDPAQPTGSSGDDAYAAGTLIWIRSEEEVWQAAEVLSSSKTELIVKLETTNDQIVVNPAKDQVYLRSRDLYTAEGLVALDDLTQLTHLHEPAVLHSLQMRFDIDKIYTFTGPILIAVNPFKTISDLYSLKTLKSYIAGGDNLAKPHVYATAAASFKGLCEGDSSQTILISGESGAGKTETTKFVMKFLALAGAGESGVSDVERQVLESNPLLEAFGNARTLRNDNSSRFGKFIELQFKPSGSGTTGYRLCGARIHTYLLEKVRVTEQQEGERNFHLFYQACAAASAVAGDTPPSLGDKLTYQFPQLRTDARAATFDLSGFGAYSNFRYLTRSSCWQLKNVSDQAQFEDTLNAMLTIGISESQINAILACVCAALHLGSVTFEKAPQDSEASVVSADTAERMAQAAKCLGVTAEQLAHACSHKTIKTATEGSVVADLRTEQAEACRDAAARYLYGRVFIDVVQKTNESIGYRTDVDLFCGVLDIFGFECFKINSFEQICINYTNERLQQFFNEFVFKLEESLYNREGIPWDPLDFPDNQASVDLLEQKPTGIFAMLDEECMVPNGSDQGFVNKLVKQHSGHIRFDVIRTRQSWFVVKHFAGPVGYESANFMDKNKDQLSMDVVELMKSSTNEYIAHLFKTDKKFLQSEGPEARRMSRKKIVTISSEFRDQLQHLMTTVKNTEPHFIRCIKPNPQNLCDVYDRPGVTEQLRYGGVLQVVQVSRAGYPVRVKPIDAWLDYRILLPAHLRQDYEEKEKVEEKVKLMLTYLVRELNIVISHSVGPVWAVGKTLVFFKQHTYEKISQRRLIIRGAAAVKIQAKYKAVKAAKNFELLQFCVSHMQALFRAKQARDLLDEKRQHYAAVQLQKKARALAATKEYRRVRVAIIAIQATWRGRQGRTYAKEYRRYRASVRIQSKWRGVLERRVFAALVKGINQMQTRWRMKQAKVQLKKLKAEAKEVGNLLAKHQKQQELMKDQTRKLQDAESSSLQLKAENKELLSTVHKLEADLKKQENRMAEIAAEEEARKAKEAEEGDLAKIKSHELDALQTEAATLREENARLKEDITGYKAEITKLQEQLEQANTRYSQLLKNTAMQSMGGAVDSRQGAQPRAGVRSVDIQLVGAQKTGKTMLLEKLIRDCDPDQLTKFQADRANFMGRYQIQCGGEDSRPLNILDCSGNSRAAQHIKEYFTRSLWVIVVYDFCSLESFALAKELMGSATRAGAGCVFFGNKFNLEQGGESNVNVMDAKDIAANAGALAVESTEIKEAVRMIARDIESEHQAGENARNRAAPGAMSQVFDRVSNMFGANKRGSVNDAAMKLSQVGVLNPSLKGTKLMKQNRREGDVATELRPVQELQDSESAVTCIVFGQERLHRSYILLAAASKDGTVVIYRCYRTEMELSMLDASDFPKDDSDREGADHSNIAVHSRLVGHSRAITSIFFNLLEDQLVTTSIDKSVRFWSVETGEMLKVFTDSSPVPVATFLPFNPQVFVAANSNAVLRLVNVQNGMVMQKLKVETEVRALKFDDSGLFLLAGTKNGSIHVLEASDSATLKFRFKVQLARGGVTCITFVPSAHGYPPCLLVNTSDSSVTIIDCTYGPPAGVLTNLTVRHRVKVAHSLLPLKCCYSPSGLGYLVSGSEDKEVYIYSLGKGMNYKMQYLKHHLVPVVAVATNHQDTLLASADSLGRIVLWRSCTVVFSLINALRLQVERTPSTSTLPRKILFEYATYSGRIYGLYV